MTLAFLPYRVNRTLGVSLGVALVVFYLIFQLLSGDHGLYALLREERRLDVLRAEYTQLHEQRLAMEKHVKHMDSGSLDPDMLDEQARAILDDAASDEVVVPLPSSVNSQATDKAK